MTYVPLSIDLSLFPSPRTRPTPPELIIGRLYLARNPINVNGMPFQTVELTEFTGETVRFTTEWPVRAFEVPRTVFEYGFYEKN